MSDMEGAELGEAPSPSGKRSRTVRGNVFFDTGEQIIHLGPFAR